MLIFYSFFTLFQPHYLLVVAMATAIPVHKFCEFNLFFFKRKKEKKCERSQSLRTDHRYGKLLFTWLSLVMSMMVSFCAVLFPTRCLG